MTHKSYLTIGDADDVPVTVHYTAHRACLGATDGRYGPKLEPDEPAWIEIDEVLDADGQPVLTSYEQEEAIQLEIAEALDDDRDTERGCDRDDDRDGWDGFTW